MGGERKLSTPDEKWAPLQQVIWKARQKTLGLVRPQRPGATDSYEQKRPSPPQSAPNQERKAMELKRAADRRNMKGFYNGLKEVWGLKKKAPVHLKSTDGMETFSDSKRVVARWSEHIQTLLNVPSDKNHEALDNIPQRITKKRFDDIFQSWMRWLEHSPV